MFLTLVIKESLVCDIHYFKIVVPDPTLFLLFHMSLYSNTYSSLDTLLINVYPYEIYKKIISTATRLVCFVVLIVPLLYLSIFLTILNRAKTNANLNYDLVTITESD